MDDLRHLLPLLIPIVAIMGGLSIPILYILTQFKKRQQLLEQNHKERMAAIERGIELPPLPIEALSDHPHHGADMGRRSWNSPARQLSTGIFWLFIGVALGVALWVQRGPEHAVWALIPIAGGLAKLMFYGLSSKAELPGVGGPKQP
jgi:hypothetical protein